MKNQETKAALYMMKCLLSVKENAKNQGLDLDRVYVKNVLIGKFKRMKGTRFHAKVILYTIFIFLIFLYIYIICIHNLI